MPLTAGNSPSVISSNISELTHHGSRPRSHAQIVAIALSNADRHPHAALGGGIGASYGGIGHFAAGGMAANDGRIVDMPFDGGLIGGSGAGRTDRLPLSVRADSHIWPADCVSALGQGTTAAGARILEAVTKGGVHGAAASLAEGGQGGRRTAILAASGEFSSTPEEIEALGERGMQQGLAHKGETAMELGHRLIDEAIARIRAFQIQWLKNAPPPKR